MIAESAARAILMSGKAEWPNDILGGAIAWSLAEGWTDLTRSDRARELWYGIQPIAAWTRAELVEHLLEQFPADGDLSDGMVEWHDILALLEANPV